MQNENFSGDAALVSMSVSAQNLQTEALELLFRLRDESVRLHKVVLMNKLGTHTGITNCVKIESTVYSAIIDPVIARRWYESGDRTLIRRSLQIRVNFNVGEQEAERTFSVRLRSESQKFPAGSGKDVDVWILEGSC